MLALLSRAAASHPSGRASSRTVSELGHRGRNVSAVSEHWRRSLVPTRARDSRGRVDRAALTRSLATAAVRTDDPVSPHVSLVQGASRGIGLAMVRQLLENEDASLPGRPAAAGGHVVATCRDPDNATALHALKAAYPNRLTVVRLDVEDSASIASAAETIGAAHGRVDVVVQTAAVLHVKGEMTPETSIARLDEAAMMRSFRVNAMGPTLVAKAFSPLLMEATARSVADGSGPPAIVANLSARVSSIGDNGLGGWYSYRASKTALNQLTKNCAIEFGRKKHQVSFILLHPGTVDTDLSAPFKKNVPPEKLFTTEFSASALLNIVGEKNQSDTGKFFAWDGSEIQW